VGSVEDGIPFHPPQAPESDLCLGGGEPLGRAHGVLPAVGPAIERFEAALNNLVLAATNNMAVLQQLAAANLALTATVSTLTVTNKKWWMWRLVRGDPRRGLRREGHGQQKLPSPATIVGCTATASARSTQVQLAPTEPLATMLMPLLQIPWVAARRTRVGARCAPDGGGWQMLSIAVLMICVNTIIIMLYPHLPSVIPPTFHLSTLALPTLVPVDFTLRPALPLQISIQRLPPSESEWRTASQRGLPLASPLLLSHLFLLQ
jgi:hypothetical protein